MVSLNVIKAAAGTANPASLVIWGVKQNRGLFRDFISRMASRTGSNSWSVTIPGREAITATMVNRSGDTEADTALKAVLWALRYPGITTNEAWRMSMNMPHGIEGRSVGPTTQDEAVNWIYERTMRGPGRPHGFAVTTGMVIALIGLLTTLASTALPELIGLQRDTIRYEAEAAERGSRTQPASPAAGSSMIPRVSRTASRANVNTLIQNAKTRSTSSTARSSSSANDGGGIVIPAGIGALAYLLL